MKKIEAKIIADSINPQGDRITTYLLTFPRFILAELNTHRVFSKNSASSRAIPFEKMVKMVKEDPFIPIAWQKDHKGMQGSEYAQYPDTEDFKVIWLEARDNAIKSAQLAQTGSVKLTKQLCNRLLEPFMWHTVLLTGTEFKNFFELRCPIYRAFGNVFKSRKDCIEKYPASVNLTDLDWLEANESQAEIHMQALAEAMWDAYNESTPKELKAGEWHIPFGDKINFGVNVNYKITKEHDLHFHRHRIMFIVKNGELLFAPQGTPQSHTEYFGDIKGLIRGFRWDDSVYTYIDNFIPIESDIVSNYFKDLKCFAGGKDFFHYKYGDNPLIKIAAARCARLSYMTFDGEIDYKKDLKLHDSLLESHHASPFEHVSRCLTEEEYNALGKMILDPVKGYIFEKGWVDNFKGFVSYRRILNF